MLRLRKSKLVPLHIHTRPEKRHTLHAQAESLFSGIFSAQLDGPARADHAMPGQARNLAQDAYHLPRRARPARGLSYSSVTRDHPHRQAANAAHDASALIIEDASRL